MPYHKISLSELTVNFFLLSGASFSLWKAFQLSISLSLSYRKRKIMWLAALIIMMARLDMRLGLGSQCPYSTRHQHSFISINQSKCVCDCLAYDLYISSLYRAPSLSVVCWFLCVCLSAAVAALNFIDHRQYNCRERCNPSN